jgi:hypothetical protein
MMHPHALRARLAVNSLHRALYYHLPVAKQLMAHSRPTPADNHTRPGRTLTPRAIAAQGAQVAEERAERVETMQRGGKPAGTGKVPVSSALIEASIAGHAALGGAQWLTASTMRLHSLLAWSREWIDFANANVEQAARLYISTCLPLMSPAQAWDVYGTVASADRVARKVTRSWDADMVPLVGIEAPCCKQRSLLLWTSGPSATWSITCENRCLCTGDHLMCKCGMEIHGKGAVIWDAQGWRGKPESMNLIDHSDGAARRATDFVTRNIERVGAGRAVRNPNGMYTLDMRGTGIVL